MVQSHRLKSRSKSRVSRRSKSRLPRRSKSRLPRRSKSRVSRRSKSRVSSRSKSRRKSLSKLRQQQNPFISKFISSPTRRLSQVDILLEKVQKNFNILHTIVEGITAPKLKRELMDEIESAQNSMELYIHSYKPGANLPEGIMRAYINMLKGTNSKLVDIRDEIRQKTPQNPNINLLRNFINISRMT